VKKENVIIRRLQAGDDQLEEYVEPINVLLRVLSEDKPKPYQIDLGDLMIALDSEDFILYVLEVDGEIAGIGSLHFHRTLTKQAAYVEDVVVLPQFHGKGFGEMIMRRLIDHAKEEEARFIELTSHPRRITANKLYQKLGFVIPGTNLYRLFLE
jgi:ribosomal protein S18 acetylase RimI-like enzyme